MTRPRMARGGSGDGGGSGDSSARDAARAELATEHVGGGVSAHGTVRGP